MGERRGRRERIGILRPLSIRDFAVLWTGMTVSMVGDGIYYIAIAWQVYQTCRTRRPRSPSSASPRTCRRWCSPLAAACLSDPPLDRRRVMVAGDLIRLVALCSVMCALSVTDNIDVPILIALVALYGTGQAVFPAVVQRRRPDIVPADILVEANSLGQFVRTAGDVAGRARCSEGC